MRFLSHLSLYFNSLDTNQKRNLSVDDSFFYKTVRSGHAYFGSGNWWLFSR